MKKKLSRQRVAQIAYENAGKCGLCGESVHPGSRTRCKKHLLEARERARVRSGYKGIATGRKPLPL